MPRRMHTSTMSMQKLRLERICSSSKQREGLRAGGPVWIVSPKVACQLSWCHHPLW